MLIEVTPIYGNGWTDGHDRIEVPPPFVVEVLEYDGKKLRGLISQSSIGMDGGSLDAGQTMTGVRDIFSCTLRHEERVFYGYCTVDVSTIGESGHNSLADSNE